MPFLKEAKLVLKAAALTLWDLRIDFLAALAVPPMKSQLHSSVAPLAKHSRWLAPALVRRHMLAGDGATYSVGATPVQAWAKYALPKGLPVADSRSLAIENDPHSLEGFSGVIEEGYGKGTKSLLYRDQVIVKVGGRSFPALAEYHFHDADRAGPHWDLVVQGVNPGTKRFEMNIPRGEYRGRYAFHTTSKGLLVVPMIDRGVRLDKNHYILRPQDQLRSYDPSQWIAERKLDGSWAAAAVGKDRVAFHSHRETGETYYDRLPAVEWVNNTSPFLFCRTIFPGPLLDGTLFRGELTHPDGYSRVSGIVNSLPTNARRIQVLRGPVDFHVWDIVRYKGRDVSMWPYAQRRELYLRLVKDIRLFNRHWHAIDAANGDFVEFYDEVTSQPLPYGEGLVLKRRDGTVDDTWPKVKRRDFAYFELLEVKEGSGKYQDSAGKMEVINPDNGAVGEVGSLAVTDEKRDWIWQHRAELRGATVKVLAQEVTDRGAPRAGVFVGFHDEGSKVHADLKMYAESVAGGDAAKARETEYAIKTSAGWHRS